MHPELGDTVRTISGATGTVTDRDMSYREALVKFDQGSTLDTSHGQWTPFAELEITGHNASAMVWRGSRQTLAG